MQEVASDFGRPLFRSVRKELSGVAHLRCSFYWSQAVIKQVKRVRLASAYRKDPSLKRSIRQLMALCYLHGETTKSVFKYFLGYAYPALKDIFLYVQRN